MKRLRIYVLRPEFPTACSTFGVSVGNLGGGFEQERYGQASRALRGSAGRTCAVLRILLRVV